MVVLGSSIAEKRHAGVGDTITLHDRPFQVVGILEPTLTAPDVTLYVPFTIGQQLAYEDLPQVLRDKVRAEDLATELHRLPGTRRERPGRSRTRSRPRLPDVDGDDGRAPSDQSVSSSVVDLQRDHRRASGSSA